MLFFRTGSNEGEEIYLDYYTGQAVVHFGVQRVIWNDPVAAGSCGCPERGMNRKWK
jgi:hypothetical protein